MTDGRPAPPVGGWRADPLEFGLREFLRTGSVEDLRIGQPKDLVRRLVPEPADWALTSDGQESDLWSYGRLDLVFAEDRLASVFCDGLAGFGDESAAADRIVVDPWFLGAGRPTLAEVRDRLESEGLVLREGVVPEYLRDQRRDLVVGSSGVTLMFEGDEDGSAKPLAAFWLDQPRTV